MTAAPLSIRRIAIVIAVVASLVLGFGVIRASADWTAAAAPLSMTPTSAEALQTSLADETARSATLHDDLAALTAHADELTAALEAAQARIDADAGQATTLAKDLAKAKAKLAALERSIRQARQAPPVRSPATVATTTSSNGARHDDGGLGDD
jgi:hypothetical protein